MKNWQAQLVIDLARQNVVDEPEMAGEAKRQIRAIDAVAKHLGVE